MANDTQSTARKARADLGCSNEDNCVAYPTLGEPLKNPSSCPPATPEQLASPARSSALPPG
jgi:hypothetical protein